MPEATYRHGAPLMTDYTPSSDVDAGEVVVVGDVPYIAHSDIVANTLGAVAARGGVYEVVAAKALSAGTKVAWSAGKVTDAGPCFGFVCPGESASTDGDVIRVEHAPDGTTLTSQ